MRAVTIVTNPIETIITTPATDRPRRLTGVTSPYPTVVTVWSMNQMAVPMSGKSRRSNSQITTLPSSTATTVTETMTTTAFLTEAGSARNRST